MAGGGQYKTKQGEEVLSYLRTTKGTHVTAHAIGAHFASEGKRISVATIYRQLERLVDSGLVNKYYLAQGGGACFEYVDKADCGGPTVCFHCKCQQCGELIHLHCHSLEEIQSHLLSGHGFQLNPKRTVFYGTCQRCSTLGVRGEIK